MDSEHGSFAPKHYFFIIFSDSQDIFFNLLTEAIGRSYFLKWLITSSFLK
jgi:hypothetical protein